MSGVQELVALGKTFPSADFKAHRAELQIHMPECHQPTLEEAFWGWVGGGVSSVYVCLFRVYFLFFFSNIVADAELALASRCSRLDEAAGWRPSDYQPAERRVVPPSRRSFSFISTPITAMKL